MPRNFSYAEKLAAIRKMIIAAEHLRKFATYMPLFDDDEFIAKLHSVESDFKQRRLPWEATP